jgi:hypothetical protein
VEITQPKNKTYEANQETLGVEGKKRRKKNVCAKKDEEQ